MTALSADIFKAYDIRGLYGTDIDEEGAELIGRAFARVIADLEDKPTNALRLGLGRDMRLTAPALAARYREGMVSEGATVLDAGMVGTEMLYFLVGSRDLDGGLMCTASHNPKAYTGAKLVRRGAIALSGDAGIQDVRRLIEAGTRVVTLLTGYTITIIGPPGLATFTITANDTSYNPSIAQFLLLLSHPDFAGTGAGSDPTGYYVTGGTQTGLAGWVVPVVVGGAIAGAVIANNNVAASPTPSPTPTAAGSGTPSPTPTPTQVPYSQLMVSTNTLTFTTVGGPAQTFTVQQTGPGGSITIGSPNCDDNGAAAMDSPPSVPPPAVACTILITGGNGQTATVNVDITSTSIGVHGLRPTSPPAPPTSGPPTPPPPPSGRPPH